MNFLAQLEAALNSTPKKPIEEAATDMQVLDRGSWMTADPDQLARVAYGKSRRVFWSALAKILKEAGMLDQYKQAIQAADPDLLRAARKEARNYAAERKVGAEAGSELATRKETPDTLHMSPEQLKAQKDQLNAQRSNQPAKSYPGDKIYGVFNNHGNLVKGGFATPQEAETYRLGDTDIPEAYKVDEYDNPKSLSVLTKTKGPLKNGWTEEEVVQAMKPFVRSIAYKYGNSKQEMEDLFQHGYIGVLNALRTDAGEAPFGTHAYKHILGEIRRAAMAGGVVAGSMVPGGGGTAQQGGTLGYEVFYQKSKDSPVETKMFNAQPEAYKDYFSKTGRTPPRSIDPGYKEAVAFVKELRDQGYTATIRDKRSGMASADKPIGGGEGEPTTLGSMMKGTKTKTPLQLAMNKEQVNHLIQKAGLSDAQKKILDLTFGLGEDSEDWGTPSSRATGKSGPPESGDAQRLPGEQAGKTPEEAGIDPSQAKQDTSWDFKAKPDDKAAGDEDRKIEIVRGPVEIGKMLGVSTERVRQLRQKAYDKLMKAAGGAGFDQMKNKMAGATAKEDKELQAMIDLGNFIRQLVIESIFNGEINGTIFG
jgi:RNA polymerase sigma factor (sigma-70 family)